jgi:hypothetical protein
MSVYFLKTLHTNLIFKFIKLEENNKPFNLKSTPQSYKKNKKNKNIEEKYYLHELLKKIFLASKSEKRKCVHQKKRSPTSPPISTLLQRIRTRANIESRFLPFTLKILHFFFSRMLWIVALLVRGIIDVPHVSMGFLFAEQAKTEFEPGESTAYYIPVLYIYI